MFARSLIQHASIVTPTDVLPDASVLIEDGTIAAIGPAAELAESFPGAVEVVDARGCFLLPGLVDLHTDTLEKEITPRPAADFPIEIAVQELDRKLVACGVTTVFHSLHFGYQEAEWSSRSRYTRREVINGVEAMKAHTLARTRVHARYEIVGHGPEVFGLVEKLLRDGVVELLSFMDHTPGQGQYTRERFMSQRMREGMTEEQAEGLLRERHARPRLSVDQLREISGQAAALGVPVASHDDDTPEKVRAMHELGVSICEFPVTLSAAQQARQLGLHVLGGAANVLRGGSLTGNLDVAAGIRAGAVDGLCSDYYPPAMLHAAFKLWRENTLTLPQAVAAVSLVPAQAAGIDDEVGSIAVGKCADLLLVRQRDETPVVAATFVDGDRVHAAERRVRRAAMVAQS